MKSAQSKPTPMRRLRSQRAATDSVMRSTHRAQRVGFTLVELMMVILIIGILVAMLVVAVNPALQRARETTIAIEMKQIDLAIESFRTKYNFYPPSFTGLRARAASLPSGTPASNVLLPFLNKISPNHRELSPMFPGGLSRLQVWWLAIGQHLDDRSSLVLWLSGLSSNKQFPITGGLVIDPATGNAQLPTIFAADLAILADTAGEVQRGEADIVDANGISTSLEREALFDFRVAQFDPQLDDQDMEIAGLRIYNQPHGNEKGNLAYGYRDAAFYDLGFQNGQQGDSDSPAAPSRSADAYYVRVAAGPSGGLTGQVFLNPDTFQLVTAGLDGEIAFGNVNQVSFNEVSAEQAATNNDNIANFANGRLDAFDWTEAVELGNRVAQ